VAFGGAETAPFPLFYTIVWVIALAAAVLTAFYMTRLMLMTFHGISRIGEKESEHLHEAPAIMWAPLAILAALSLFGGWVNVPEALQTSWAGLGGALPTTEWLHHWLEPITEQAHHIQEANLGELGHTAPFGGGEVLWAFISTAAALLVVLVAVRVVGSQEIRDAAEDETQLSGFGKLLLNKYYVDELYDRFIVNTVRRKAEFFWKVVDVGIIDRFLNALGWVTKGVGWGVSMFQTGAVNTYAFVITVGALIILGVSVLI
jgi:NADH-quinone oxidoreductase subunit L